jgi:hypothetical protein
MTTEGLEFGCQMKLPLSLLTLNKLPPYVPQVAAWLGRRKADRKQEKKLFRFKQYNTNAPAL